MTKRRAAEDYPHVEITSRAELREWLASHHATSQGAWIVTWRKHMREVHVSWDAVVEEAICFGWIDSLPRALDADRTMLLVTPRKPTSAWSRVNKGRVAALLEARLIAPAGLAVIEAAKASGTWSSLDDVDALVVPADLERALLDAGATARANFEAFPPSARRGILEWIQNAKRPDTRQKRVAETARLAAINERANAWKP